MESQGGDEEEQEEDEDFNSSTDWRVNIIISSCSAKLLELSDDWMTD